MASSHAWVRMPSMSESVWAYRLSPAPEIRHHCRAKMSGWKASMNDSMSSASEAGLPPVLSAEKQNGTPLSVFRRKSKEVMLLSLTLAVTLQPYCAATWIMVCKIMSVHVYVCHVRHGGGRPNFSVMSAVAVVPRLTYWVNHKGVSKSLEASHRLSALWGMG